MRQGLFFVENRSHNRKRRLRSFRNTVTVRSLRTDCVVCLIPNQSMSPSCPSHRMNFAPLPTTRGGGSSACSIMLPYSTRPRERRYLAMDVRDLGRGICLVRQSRARTMSALHSAVPDSSLEHGSSIETLTL